MIKIQSLAANKATIDDSLLKFNTIVHRFVYFLIFYFKYNTVNENVIGPQLYILKYFFGCLRLIILTCHTMIDVL